MLFHEIYGSYYRAAASILKEAVQGKLTGKELDALARHFTSGGSLDETEYRKHCINCPKTIIQY